MFSDANKHIVDAPSAEEPSNGIAKLHGPFAFKEAKHRILR